MLVVGTGIAGLFFAVKAARYGRVAIVTKKDRPESSTNYAQGGVAAVFGADDSPALHARDTLIAGAGLCHRTRSTVLVTEGPLRVRELIELGVRFSRARARISRWGGKGGHSRRRIVRADDLTGREIERALLDAVASDPNIELHENHMAVDLLTAEDPDTGGERCCGASCSPRRTHRPAVVFARAVVLATGGCGQVYRHTTNPASRRATGSRWRTAPGAKIANMEFVQFHPTALYPASDRSFLISEAVRGEGAVLRRLDGTPFMDAYHPLGSLAPRDVVARAIDGEMKRSGDPYVLLDCSPIDAAEIRGRFPNILAETARRGIDMLREPLPVVPAAHYLCGGVLTDTVRPHLAAGALRHRGDRLHGRPRRQSAGLQLAPGGAGLRPPRGGAAGATASRRCAPSRPTAPSRGGDGAAGGGGRSLVHDRDEIRSLMWDLVGIVRTRRPARPRRGPAAADRGAVQPRSGRATRRRRSWWSCGTSCRRARSSPGALSSARRAGGSTSRWTTPTATTSTSSATPSSAGEGRAERRSRRMKVILAVVGRARGGLAAPIAEYEKRAARYHSLEVVEVKEQTARHAGGPAEVMEEEGKRLLARIPPGFEVVALHRLGEGWSSVRLAEHLAEQALRASPGIAFLIGGAFGLSDEVLERARHRLSLSAFTLPHEMARLVLAEQLYRAGTIARGEPYHKGIGG